MYQLVTTGNRKVSDNASVTVVCDICGESVDVEMAEGALNTIFLVPENYDEENEAYELSGWKSNHEEDLCPVCYAPHKAQFG